MTGPIAFDADIQLANPTTVPTPQSLPIIGANVVFATGFDLPGVSASARGFGLGTEVAFRFDRGGNVLAGLLHISDPRAIPPTTISIELEGPLPGGGWLEYDFDTNIYRGAIGVNLGFVIVSGFASLQVDDPVSIVAILAATFRPPIQLSFGFTLVGVGGIVGINRTYSLPGLTQALGTGELGDMFFPRDPAGDAIRILPAMDRCFPVSRGTYFGGPMLKLGWGTPTLVSATVAVIVSSKGEVLILGLFALSLPCEDAPFAVISATVFGHIDSGGVFVRGSLVNSHIGPITIDGDACFALRDDAMALSVGGFHPAYPVPPGFDGMKRISASMSPLAFVSMCLEGYFALTPASLQFGGRVRLRADLEVAAVEGEAGFDALILFSPFRFQADFRGRISVEVMGERIGGISLNARISGPGRWEVAGEVTIEILWWDIDVSVEFSWGSRLPEPLATTSAFEILAGEVARPQNWSAASLGEVARWLVLNPLAPSEIDTTSVLSPLGAMTFVQQAVPLGMEITRIGGQRLPGAQSVHLSINGQEPNVSRPFPAGHIVERPPESLITGNGMVTAPAGVTLSVQQRICGTRVAKSLDFEDLILKPADHRLLTVDILRSATSISIAETLLVADFGAAGRGVMRQEIVNPDSKFTIKMAGGGR